MIDAYCDRCNNKIPDYTQKEHNMMIINPNEDEVMCFDLCLDCGATITAQISDFVKGA